MKDVTTIILAAGKGTRMKKSDGNKVVTLFHDKPLIVLAVELALSFSDQVIVVVGVHEESVRLALASYPVTYVHQSEQKGTAHATKLAIDFISNHPPKYVVVGYGDHMMFYSSTIIQQFIQKHISSSSVLSLVTAHCDNPNSLAYGRIVRTHSGQIDRIVEQKDASEDERAITEINAGLYCFDYQFLRQNIHSIKASPTSGEYYLTDMVALANQNNKCVSPFVIPFDEIGYGINSKEDLEKSLQMKK